MTDKPYEPQEGDLVYLTAKVTRVWRPLCGPPQFYFEPIGFSVEGNDDHLLQKGIPRLAKRLIRIGDKVRYLITPEAEGERAHDYRHGKVIAESEDEGIWILRDIGSYQLVEVSEGHITHE